LKKIEKNIKKNLTVVYIMDKLEKLDVKENTKKVYMTIMKRLLKTGYKPQQKQFQKIKKIKQFIESNFEKASTRLDMLNVLLITSDNEKLIDDIKKYRITLQKQKVDSNVKRMNEVGKTLPSKETFEEKLNELYEQKKYKEFIPNFLIFNYGVRNNDVNVIIKKKGKYVVSDQQNYLLLKKKGVEFLRNDYKTSKTYGPKRHFISDERFIDALKQMDEGYLFNQEKQLGNELRKVLIFKMTESQIFKMLIDDAYKNKDTPKINELSESRGTSIDTIKENYDVNATEQIIKKL
jgi:hypothetical protein